MLQQLQLETQVYRGICIAASEVDKLLFFKNAKDGSMSTNPSSLGYMKESKSLLMPLLTESLMQVEEVSEKIDATVEPVIEELEKDLIPNPRSSSGSDAQK